MVSGPGEVHLCSPKIGCGSEVETLAAGRPCLLLAPRQVGASWSHPAVRLRSRSWPEYGVALARREVSVPSFLDLDADSVGGPFPPVWARLANGELCGLSSLAEGELARIIDALCTPRLKPTPLLWRALASVPDLLERNWILDEPKAIVPSVDYDLLVGRAPILEA